MNLRSAIESVGSFCAHPVENTRRFLQEIQDFKDLSSGLSKLSKQAADDEIIRLLRNEEISELTAERLFTYLEIQKVTACN